MRTCLVAFILWATTCAAAGARQDSLLAACSGEGEPRAVIAACTSLIESGVLSSENTAIAHSNRGLAYSRLNDPARAVSDFDAAISIDSTYAPAFTNRGASFALAGDLDRAMSDLNEAVRLDPRAPLALRNRALVHQSRGNYQHAVDDFSRAIEVSPLDVEVRNGRCWVRVLWRRQFDEALADCNEALRLDPDHASALNSRAAVNFLRGDFEEAVADYTASLTIEPNLLPGSYFGRGAALARLGNVEAGRVDMTRGIGLEPGVAERYARLGITPN